MGSQLFESFFMGGFECSTHRLKSGRRLDEIDATQHDQFATEDYLRLRSQGMLRSQRPLRSQPSCYFGERIIISFVAFATAASLKGNTRGVTARQSAS